MKNKVITFLFLAIIATPAALDLLGVKFKSTSENRALKSKPVLTFEKGRTSSTILRQLKGFYVDLIVFKNNYKAFYADNFVLKPMLFKLYYHIKVDIFNTDPLPQKVVTGKDGWMFLGNSSSDVIRESKGIVQFSNDQINNIKQNLLAQRDWLGEKGIVFIVAVVPNKHTVYGEYLPIRRSSQKTKLNQLKEELSQTDLNFVDLSEALDKKSEKLYYKTDSHWNHLGAFYGYLELINVIRQFYPDIQPLELNNFDRELKTFNQMDLSRLLDLHIPDENVTLTLKHPAASKIPGELEIPSTHDILSEPFENRLISQANSKKLILFGDSFRFTLIQYLSEHFGESIFLRGYSADKEIIDREKPDVVIIELVERHLDLLLTQ